MNQIVVAANNLESTKWLLDLPPGKWTWWISDEFHPPGREAYAYLEHLLFMINLTDDIVLCQGNPFAHDPDFFVHLDDSSVRYYGEVHECSNTGSPACDYTPLDEWCRILGLAPQKIYKFVAGAQYRLNAKQARTRPRAFYKALLYLTTIEGNKSAWVLERLWPLIFGIDLP